MSNNNPDLLWLLHHVWYFWAYIAGLATGLIQRQLRNRDVSFFD